MAPSRRRNVAIVTHHEVNVPRNTDSEEVKERVRKINSLLASESIAEGSLVELKVASHG